MHTIEHTDLDGDALTIHRDKGLAWVTVTRDEKELTVGPVPADVLEPLGSYVRRDDVDAVPIINEVARLDGELYETRIRVGEAEKERGEAVAERDSTRGYAEELEDAVRSRDEVIKARTAERDEARADAAESRPLTPDAITDEVVKRALAARDYNGQPYFTSDTEAHDLLAAALTEPPARPEGAEELGELIGEYLDSTPGVDDMGMADFLAGRGVRVVGGEDPR